MKAHHLSLLAVALALSASPAFAVDNIKLDFKPPLTIDKPDHSGEIDIGKGGDGKGGGKADSGDIEIDKSHGKNGGVILTPDIVDALGGTEPGPLTPKNPGGTLEVDDTPQIVILDDGVGSNLPGGPGDIGKPGASTSPGALVLRLACAFGPDGLVIRNVGDIDAPIGLKLRWQARGIDLAGTVRLDSTLRVGHAASLGGVAATGQCGVTLVS